MLDEAIDAAAARSTAQAGAQFGQIGLRAGDHDLHFALFGIAYPSAQVKLSGLTLHIPAEAYALHTALNEKVKNHCL